MPATNKNLSGPLNETERCLIYTSLRVAAEQYRAAAAQFEKVGNTALAHSMYEQANSADKWSELIEAAREVRVTQ